MLIIVGVLVLGPDKLPSLARDVARMIQTLRDLSAGARAQLRDGLGPEFADLDLRSLNPRTAIQRALLTDDDDDAADAPPPQPAPSASTPSPTAGASYDSEAT